MGFMSKRVNKSFKSSGDKPEFMYKRNPLVDHSFQIFYYQKDKKDYELAGEYILLNTSEPIDLTEKKVINIITFLNNKDALLDLRNLTKTRLLYNIVPIKAEDAEAKLIFREYDGSGTSVENAVLTIKKGVINVKELNKRLERQL
jgi:hypothetical protein